MRVQRRDVAAATGGAIGVGVTVALLRLAPLDNAPTIAALGLLLVVFGTATMARLGVAIATSLVAMLAFNFFFLPPLHTFTVADPQNVVALVVFLAVAVVASQLSAAARKGADERIRFLEARRAAELTAQRAELASALLASLSHDLRTPLTAARVGVANALDAGLPEPQRREQGRLAAQELDRLTHMFDALLDMARIDAGALHPRREWTTAAEIVDAAVASLTAPLNRHRLEMHAPDDVLVEVDPRLTAAALARILENAAKHTPETAAIRVRAEANVEGLGLAVEDEGPGVDQAEIDRLFEPFFRGRAVRTAGTGLGLSIARGLVVAQGGRIRAERLVPRGTRFSLAIPGRTKPARHGALE